MKNIQISEELFFALLKYHLVEIDDVLPEIKKGLEDKLEAMVRRVYIQSIRLHQPKKNGKRHGRSIWIRWECIGISDGKFSFRCI